MLIREHLPQYFYLMRLHKPIGILLLLWPTLWALWLASAGLPDTKILLIFIAGVVLMRSAGCVVNDFADRHFDINVKRTKLRPLARGTIKVHNALLLAFILFLSAFLLVLLCNTLTIKLAILGALLAVIYPFLKRITHLPQLGLGLAFSWGVPMSFAAIHENVSVSGWFLFFTSAIWPLIYDTMYAIVDREDDIKIGVHSTAILFDDMDRLIIALLQLLFITMLIIVGLMFRLHAIFYFCVSIVLFFFLYQQWLIKDRDVERCFKAFTNNNLVGFIIFGGIVLNYLMPFWGL